MFPCPTDAAPVSLEINLPFNLGKYFVHFSKGSRSVVRDIIQISGQLNHEKWRIANWIEKKSRPYTRLMIQRVRT